MIAVTGENDALSALLAAGREPRLARVLVYQRRQHTINLFIWPESAGAVTENVRSMRGFQLRHWSRDGMSFWAFSDLNDAELAEFERALQH